MNTISRIFYALAPDFECVHLINGAFNETPGDISYPADSPLYVTVLPLKAILLPYTIKLVGGKVAANAELATAAELSPGYFQVRLKERYNYVYSPSHASPPAGEKGVPAELFRRIKAGDTAGARQLMTKELSSSIDDSSLIAFFQLYDSIMENKFKDLPGSYYLFNTETKKNEAFSFTMKNNLVDNIDQI